jgi:hypothetical protein
MSTEHNYGETRALLIHASAVCGNNGVLLFIAPSETGKSTICHMLQEAFRPLADDLAWLIPQRNGTWGIANALDPTSKESFPIEQALGEPLQAIIRLYQAPAPRLEHISALETCRHLTKAFLEAPNNRFSDADTLKDSFRMIAATARQVSGYCFHFNLSQQAVQIVESAFKREFVRVSNPDF